MVDRVVSTTLSANVSGFVASMRTAQASMRGFTSEVDKSARRRQMLLGVGNAAGAIGIAAAAGVGLAVKAAADFDKAMSGVSAATRAPKRELEQLRGLALKLGADTVFSATEAADGITQLAKAGVSTKDIMRGGLKGALSLAAAGELEVGDAAEAAATAMTQFGLKGKQIPHVADLLAAAAGKAQGEVSDFSYALKQSGLVANQTGLSIEETTGTLAAFASQGLIGSDAGTSLKTMLQSLTPASERAEDAMERHNIEAYNQQGQFIGLTKFAGKLRDGLKGLSAEQRNATLKTVFGSDAVRAATVLYDQGAGGMSKWIRKVNDAGFAADTAAKKQDNLAGDIEKLKGALSTALIETGSGAQGPLRQLTQGITGAVDAFNSLPKPAKSAAFWITAVVGAAGGAAFIGSRFVAALSDGRAALSNFGGTASKTGASVSRTRGMFSRFTGFLGGPWGIALAGAGVALGAWMQSQANAKEDVQAHTRALNRQTGAITRQNAELVIQKASEDGVFASGKKLGISVATMTRALLGNRKAIAEVNRAAVKGFGDASLLDQAFRGLTNTYRGNQQAAVFVADAVENQNDRLRASRVAWREQRQGMGAANDVLGRTTKATKAHTRELKDMSERLNLGERRSKQLNKALRDEEDASQKAGKGSVLHERQLKSVANQLGLNEKKTRELIREYGKVPKDIKTDAKFDDSKARRDTNSFIGFFNSSLKGIKNEDVDIELSTKAEKIWRSITKSLGNVTGFFGGGGGQGFHTGGWTGPGGKMQPAGVVHADEHVIRKESRQRIERRHPGALDFINEHGELPGYAAGGPVGTSVVSSPLRQRGMAEAARSVGVVAERFADRIGSALSKRTDSLLKQMIVGGGEFPHDYSRHQFRGVTLDRRTILMVKAAESILSGRSKFDMSQGSYNAGGVAASGGTHDGGGVFDAGSPFTRAAIVALRKVGFAAWRRYPSQGPWSTHIHSLDPKNRRLSSAARGQAIDFRHGGDGLDGRDYEPRPRVIGNPNGGGGVRLRRGGGNYGGGTRGIVRGIAARRGWDTGHQWDSIVNLVREESAWNPNADNPTSSASGLFQHVDGTWRAYRKGSNASRMKFANVHDQAVAGMRYIKAVYGGPVGAWRHWQRAGTYDQGGVLKPGLTLAANKTGKDELVRTNDETQEDREAARRERREAERERRQAGRERRQGRREHNNALDRLLKDFNLKRGMSAGEAKSEMAELRTGLRSMFGSDAPIIDRLKDMSKKLELATKSQGELRKAMNEAKEKRAGFQSRRNELAGTVSGGFTGSLFGEGQPMDDLFTRLRAQRNDARGFRQDLMRLRNRGLNDALIQDLASSGDYTTADGLTSMSRRELRRLNQLNKQRLSAARSVGEFAGQVVFSDEMRPLRREIRNLTHAMNKGDRRLERHENRIERAVERGSERGTERGQRRNGDGGRRTRQHVRTG